LMPQFEIADKRSSLSAGARFINTKHSRHCRKVVTGCIECSNSLSILSSLWVRNQAILGVAFPRVRSNPTATPTLKKSLPLRQDQV
jgi:hypothetical protein